jgi:hypothetical protein
MKKVALICLCLLGATSLVGPFYAQGGRGNAPAAPAAPAAPTPHLPNGHVNFSSPPGEHGIWAPAGINQLYIYPFSVNRASAATQLPNAIREENVPFQPWARALHNTRELNIESDEPHTRCKASPGPREFITPYGVEMSRCRNAARVHFRYRRTAHLPHHLYGWTAAAPERFQSNLLRTLDWQMGRR